MHFLTPLPLLLPLVLSSSLPPQAQEPQQILSNPLPHEINTNKIPTSRESAILARRILHLTPLGTLSTIFPSTSHNASTPDTDTDTLEQRPQGLENTPIGLMDYISDCEGNSYPTLLAITIATTFKNAASGSNVSLSINWIPPYPPKSRISSFSSSIYSWFSSDQIPDPYAYSAANLPRFSLSGYLEPIAEEEVQGKGIAECFVKRHQDARYWLPGNRIHHSEWMRLVVTNVYWIGGFGDRAYIGWIPVSDWESVEEREWRSVRLVGERKGWREWSLGGEDL